MKTDGVGRLLVPRGWEESGMGARQGGVGVGWGNIWLGQRGWREWEDWPVTSLMRL